MVDRFNGSRLGDWVVFCDICGQKCYASEASRLSTYTGRGGLIVCPADADKIDYGLVPYKPPTERNIPWTRINHTNTSSPNPTVDYETISPDSLGDYNYLIDESGNFILDENNNYILVLK